MCRWDTSAEYRKLCPLDSTIPEDMTPEWWCWICTPCLLDTPCRYCYPSGLGIDPLHKPQEQRYPLHKMIQADTTARDWPYPTDSSTPVDTNESPTPCRCEDSSSLSSMEDSPSHPSDPTKKSSCLQDTALEPDCPQDNNDPRDTHHSPSRSSEPSRCRLRSSPSTMMDSTRS